MRARRIARGVIFIYILYILLYARARIYNEKSACVRACVHLVKRHRASGSHTHTSVIHQSAAALTVARASSRVARTQQRLAPRTTTDIIYYILVISCSGLSRSSSSNSFYFDDTHTCTHGLYIYIYILHKRCCCHS